MITYRLARDDELALAFRLALRRFGLAEFQVRGQAESLLALAGRQGLGTIGQWLAERDGRAISACAQLTSPGRTATVVLPSCDPQFGGAEVAGELLLRMRNTLTSRGILLQQVLLAADMPALPEAEAVLKEASFEFLAELLYLELRLADHLPTPEPPHTDQLTWVAYRPELHDRLAAVVQGTYQGSLDCPGLTGRRPIEDVLASHRAAGIFRADRWLLAEFGDRPAGCLLMSRAPLSNALEVVYMGLLPWGRGRRWGRALLVKAEQLARQAGAERITLAVDQANIPAVGLYRRYGFAPRHQRRAWIFSSAGAAG